MDRRQFVRYGATGVAGLALGAVPGLTWLADLARAGLVDADGGIPQGQPWHFGVMADSQWQRNVDGRNPGASAIGLIQALNRRFVAHGVRFVIQLGDMVDVESDVFNANPALKKRRTLPIRALAAQSLYDAGIGFFPLRGNHEDSQTAANEFVGLYPQTCGQSLHGLGGAHDFRSPSVSLDGLSYSFDAGNVRFVLLDQFMRLDGTGDPLGHSNIIDQQAWIDETLSTRPSGYHALVFGHKPLVGQYHLDTLLGRDSWANAAARDAFIGGLHANGVHYYVAGHDHLHNRSFVRSPNGLSFVEQMTCAPCAFRYRAPVRPAHDAARGHKPRETNIAQEAYTVGYYIFTVDGANVTVDYYAASNGLDYGHGKITRTPAHPTFHRRERWGYGLDGARFLVRQGGSYTGVKGTFTGTSARILSGKNRSKSKDGAGRKLAKVVNTGWAAAQGAGALSSVFRVWGLATNLAVWDPKLKGLLPKAGRGPRTDTYVLAMTPDPSLSAEIPMGGGNVGIAAKNALGAWFNAVDFNYGGAPRFVTGPWKSGYPLGTYGVDPTSGVAWAVLNHEAEFVVTGELRHGAGAQRTRA